jgi:cytochrome c-type biogenesis protein CcmF
VSAELGHFAVILTLLVAAVQACIGFAGAGRGRDAWMLVAPRAAVLQLGLLFIAGAALIRGFVTSDFSLNVVAANSHIDKPLLYKIAGSWGNHEGSMLMWAFILALYGALFAVLSGRLPLIFRARVLATQALVSLGFLSFILFTSNPFARSFPAPFEGRGLNPILQDPALAAHPPLLYAGYVGYSLCFSFAIAAMLDRQISTDWAAWVRRWALLAWMFLTAGIALGSFWAYYELGWGGFWFWDPVENASFMPWLAGTAFLHSIKVTARQGHFMRWTVLLAILTFALSLIGTFLVRSGVLTSVHAFANDPARGVYILAIIAATIGGALALYSRATFANEIEKSFQLLSREAALLLNNIFLATATATVFIGTLYPLAIDALGLGKISVGPPYFAAVFLPLCIPFFVILPFGPVLAWGRASWLQIRRALAAPLVAALLAALAFMSVHAELSLSVLAALFGAMWLIMSSIATLLAALDIRRAGLWGRLGLVPPSVVAGNLAHAGIGLMLLGIIGATAWRAETVVAVAPGDRIQLGGYQFVFEAVSQVKGPNYVAERARIVMRDLDGRTKTLTPEKRIYSAERSQTTEAAIDVKLSRHIYAVLGEQLEDGRRVIRIWEHPLVAFIWLGALVMVLAGGFGLRGGRR